MTWRPVFVKGDIDPPTPDWPEGGRTVTADGIEFPLKQLPDAVALFVEMAERGDERVTVEWRTAPSGEFEIRVRPADDKPLRLGVAGADIAAGDELMLDERGLVVPLRP